MIMLMIVVALDGEELRSTIYDQLMVMIMMA